MGNWHRPLSAGAGVLPCSGDTSAWQEPDIFRARHPLGLDPTSAGRSSSTAPPAPAFWFGEYSTIFPYQGSPFNFVRSECAAPLGGAPRREAYARARPDFPWFRSPCNDAVWLVSVDLRERLLTSKPVKGPSFQGNLSRPGLIVNRITRTASVGLPIHLTRWSPSTTAG